MNVIQLIDELQKIKVKTKRVVINGQVLLDISECTKLSEIKLEDHHSAFQSPFNSDVVLIE